ncbi:MAG: hypothetical protein HC853_01700 [Anaerolineae bacterium]|nr:hypothetical protein [Anaerolineae bacterium]
MKKFLKILGVIFGGLVGLVLIAVVAIFAISESQINKAYAIKPESLAVVVPTDANAIKEGERLANIRGCTGCHTPDLGGEPKFFDNPLAAISAANLTRGAGGRASGYTDEDWVRAIRQAWQKMGMACG